MKNSTPEITKILAKEFNISFEHANNTVSLLEDGNTVPFIARYRKELTGSLSDDILRNLSERLDFLKALDSRKAEVTRLIDEQDKLTSEIEQKISAAVTMSELEDIYRPYRPKRRTRASIAKEKGLEPFAEFILEQQRNADPESEALKYINAEKGVNSAEDALNGAMDIIAETISDHADYRKYIRTYTKEHGIVITKVTKDKTEEDSVYSNYYDYSEPISKLANHRLLAINRAEREGYISVKIEVDEDKILDYLYRTLTPKRYASPSTQYVKKAAEDAYKRLISSSIENEIRSELTEAAQESSIQVFKKNLSGLLLIPPVKGMVVLGFDPGYRTGCKLAVVDETGKVLDTGIVHCTLPKDDKAKAKKQLKDMIERNKVDLVSIGNGTASKESEIFISELIKEIERPVYYVMTNEAGASVYSASKLAAEEFPEYDVTLRSAVSIARRVQDPLAELVKIDPQSIGVGQYQHDMNKKRLGEALGGVVEDCVNSVGIDLNTASPSLLSYAAGINKTVAKNIAEYREENGKFTSRRQLLKVPKLGAKAFEQCAGFMRITDGTEMLDNTSVHPESYKAAKELLSILGYSEQDAAEGKISDIKEKISGNVGSEIAVQLGIGEVTLRDIADSLLKRGRDPREELPQPVLRSDLLSIDDLKPGMILNGTVRNVIDFGAFVDIGVHQDGLVHISEIADRYIKHPSEVLSVGDQVKVLIKDIDSKKGRISLSMRDVN